MSSLKLIGEEETIEVNIRIEAWESEPTSATERTTSINGNNRSSTRYHSKADTVETAHLTPDKVDEIEELIINNDHILECEGAFTGEYEVTVENSEYIAFYKNGDFYPNGETLLLRLEDIPNKNLWMGGGE